MAKNYKKIYEDRYGTKSSTTDKLQNQINNYKARLEAGGVDNPSTDNRNALEKWLNLEQDQNVIFDVFEVLNRPQQALFGAIDAGLKGEDVGEAALEHLKGNKETSGKDLLLNHTNMEDTDTLQDLVAQGETFDIKKPFASLKTIAKATDLVDLAGLGLDVFADPLDAALIPVGGAGGVTGTLTGLGKAVDNAGDAIKTLDTVSDAVKTTKNLKSVNDLLFEGTGKLAKGGAKLADTSIERGLSKLDAMKGIKYADETAKSAANLGKYFDEGSEAAGKLGKLEVYKSAKETASNALKFPDKVKKAILKGRSSEVEQEMTRVKLKMLRDNELVGAAKKFIKNQKNKVYDNVDDVLDDVVKFGEYTKNMSISNREILTFAKRGELEGKQEFIDTLNNMIKKDVHKSKIKELKSKYKEPLKIEVDEKGYIKLGEGFDDISLDTSGSTVLKRSYTPEQQAHLDELVSRYYNNEDGFRNLVDGINGTAWKNAESTTPGISKYEELFGEVFEGGDEIQISVMDKANKIIDEILGTNLSSKYNPLENSDYVLPHILSESAEKLKNPPISEELLSRRKHLGSIDEVNNFIKDVFSKIPEEQLTAEMKEFIESGADFMETSLLKAFDNRYLGEYGLTGSVRKNKLANDVLLDLAFSDFEKSKKLRTQLDVAYKNNEGMEVIGKLKKELNELESSSVIKYLNSNDNKIPRNFVLVKKDKFKNKLKDFQASNRRYGNEALEKRFKKIASDIGKNGGDIAINEDIARMLGIVSDKKTLNGLKVLYDKYLGWFKKWKTASPTFVMNAFFGNTSNLALSGISPLEQAKYGAKVADIMQNGETYYKAKLAGQALSSSQDDVANLWYEYRKMGFDRAALDLNEIPEEMQDLITGKIQYNSKVSKAFNIVPHINNIVNNTFDTSGRLTFMLKALDYPSYMKNLGVDNVYDAISKVMFDPSMITSSEKTLKNFVPFYTYSKNNLVFQATNLLNNPTKYSRLLKGMKHLQKSATGDNEENMQDYIKDSLYIPIPGLDANGNYTILRTSLPFGQLTDTISDPKQALINSLTPALKAPFEYATNIDSFTGREIESFPGEKSTQIPFLTKKGQKFLSDFSGLDVPLKNLYRIGEGAVTSEEGILPGIGQGFMDTLTMQGNIDTDKISRQYDEIDELQNLMKQYEQEGYEFSTMTELRKANKNNTVAGINAIFAKYGIDQKSYQDYK